MYLRYTIRKKDGKVHRYWRLVRSVRVGRRVVQQTVAHLGELNEQGRVAARAPSMGYRSCFPDPEESTERPTDMASARRPRSGSHPRLLSCFRAMEKPGDVAAARRPR